MCKRTHDVWGAKAASGWRNEQLHALRREMDLRHVHIQPFEALTAERWDYHSSTKWMAAKRQWVSDCTHFCYSPSFWDLSFHELYESLAQGRLWLQRRHASMQSESRPPRDLLQPTRRGFR